MAYTDIDDPTIYFANTIWTGNNTNDRDIVIAGTGMQPDLFWVKGRSNTQSHFIFDTVRATNISIHPDTNAAESSQAYMLRDPFFNSDGVNVGTDAGINANSQTYIAWSWNTGTSFSNDASSTSVGTIDSAGSVTTDAAFSIITYTGTGTAGTVAHGLGKLPKMIIAKQRNSTANWSVYFLDTSIAYNNVRNYLELNTNIASTGDSGARWGAYGNYSTTTFGVGTNAANNASGSTYVAYVFSDIQGYSKIGKYTGNGNADGPFIYTGFQPAFVMVKRTDGTGDWAIMDTARNPFNVINNYLKAQGNDAESTDASFDIDAVSNGFKVRYTNSNYNGNGGSYIYMAFAKNPFVNSEGVPGNAR